MHWTCRRGSLPCNAVALGLVHAPGAFAEQGAACASHISGLSRSVVKKTPHLSIANNLVPGGGGPVEKANNLGPGPGPGPRHATTSCAIRGARCGGIGRRSPPGSSEELGSELGWVWSGGTRDPRLLMVEIVCSCSSPRNCRLLFSAFSNNGLAKSRFPIA